MNKKKLGIIVFLFYFVYTFFLSDIPLDIFNIDLTTISTMEKILYLLLTDLVLILILFLVYRKDFKKDLGDFKLNWRTYLDMGFKYWIVGIAVMGASNFIIQYYVTDGIAANETTVRELIKSFPIYMVFATCFYAPLVEETIFRKSLKDILGYNLIFVFASGFIFGGLHVIGSATSVSDLLFIIPYSSLGVAFAYLYYKTKNIFSSIIMHTIHNTIFVALEIFVLFKLWGG